MTGAHDKDVPAGDAEPEKKEALITASGAASSAEARTTDTAVAWEPSASSPHDVDGAFSETDRKQRVLDAIRRFNEKPQRPTRSRR